MAAQAGKWHSAILKQRQPRAGSSHCPGAGRILYNNSAASALETGAVSYHLNSKQMNCRPGCGACCIAPSISSAIPGMHQGKPAGVRCVQLDAANRCLIFGQPGRPVVCGQLAASPEMCGTETQGRQHAMLYLARLEILTAPQ